ncbi:GerAB/ArcD/ProY family transporter [Clostridium tepidiprofundi]|nr:endospore germination permease [Clostridium tepidiprofundi]
MNESLSNKQIIFIIYGTIVGYGIVGLPRKAVEAAGTSGWICILIAGIISTFVTHMILYLSYVYKDKTLFEYSNILVGKYITYVFVSIYIIYFFIMFTMITRISSEVIRLTILLETPQMVLCIFFYLVAYYAVMKKIRVVGRLNEIYSIITICFIVSIQLTMFSQGKLINLKPYVVTSDVVVYFINSFKMIFSFLGMEILVAIPLTKENDKKIFKYSSFMIIGLTFLYIILTESCIALMGVDDVIHYKDVLFVAIRRVDIQPLQFLRRMDGIFISAWIMVIICSVMLFSYGAILFVDKLFNKIKYNIIVFVVFVLSFVFSQIPKTIAQIEKIIDMLSYLGVVTVLIIPLILFIITKVKRYA